jgi:Carboxypeptidase regulatory-like domain
MTVVDSRGEPLTSNRGSVSLIREVRNSSSSYGLNSSAPGIFEAKNVTAGEYGISAQVNGPDGGGRPREYVYTQIRVEGDVEGLALATSPGVSMKGEIVVDGAPRPDLQNVRIGANAPRGWRATMGSHGPVAVGPDLTFEIKDVFGPRIVMPWNLPRGWSLKEVRYGSDDVTDIAIEPKGTAEPQTLRVVITNRGATVRGRVVDDRGNAVPDAPVILFSTDPQRWRMDASTTGLTVTREDGTFEITGKRAGDYQIASPQDSPVFGGDLERTLKWLAPLAERITLTEEDRRVVDLRPVPRQ